MVRSLVVIEPSGSPRRFALEGELITIGRSAACDLALPGDSGLSRQHACMRHEGAGWLLVDFGSRNGTLLNGAAVTAPVPLKEGDRIRIGGTEIICAGDEAPAAAVYVHAEETSGGGSGPLRFPGRRMTVEISDTTPFAFGRSSSLFRGGTDETGPLCVKLFSQASRNERVNLLAFEREVRAQSTLKHPNILPVIDFGIRSEPHGLPFVIFPFCEGGSLRQFAAERSFHSLEAVLPLLDQVAAAIDAAHAAGCMHGDVKPENILLSADHSTAYLSDFGMSNVFAIQESLTTTVVSGPRAGGTSAYLSPEQIARGQQTPLSDIYAFTIVAYELVTGRLPFDVSAPPFVQMTAKVKGEVLDPQQFNPLLCDEAKNALLAGLDRDPLRRPRPAGALCRMLRAAVPDAGSKLSQPNVFISYCHRDALWLDRVKVHFAAGQKLSVWDDTRIRAGQRWLEEIEHALESATCAILLVSAHFLASEFCTQREVPALLRKARERGVRILTVIVSPCRFGELKELAEYQAINDPRRTLAEMAETECERVLMRLAEAAFEPAV